MDWSVPVVLAGLVALFVTFVGFARLVVAALVDVLEWLIFQLRNPSRESVPSFLKGALWSLGILAYGWGATRLSFFVVENYQINRALASTLGFLRNWAHLGHWARLGIYFAIFGSTTHLATVLWVGLLAVAAWQVTVRGHETAGRMLTAMAGIAAVVSVLLWIRTIGTVY